MAPSTNCATPKTIHNLHLARDRPAGLRPSLEVEASGNSFAGRKGSCSDDMPVIGGRQQCAVAKCLSQNLLLSVSPQLSFMTWLDVYRKRRVRHRFLAQTVGSAQSGRTIKRMMGGASNGLAPARRQVFHFHARHTQDTLR